MAVNNSQKNNPKKKFARSRSVGNLNPGIFRNRSLSSDQLKVGSPRSSEGRRQSTPDVNVKKSTPYNQYNSLSTILEKEKQELKSKVTELEDFKDKYENEKKENQILKNRLSELLAGQSNATQNLMRANESLDRLRLDQKKKTEQIEKQQRDISFKDDRIRNLEIRASEVEKAELILETTKQNLESQIQQVRIRDGQIRRLEKDVDDAERRIETSNKTIKDLEEKLEDLKIQVRHELMKNDNVEKNLEMIPRYKDTIKEKEEEVCELNKQLTEKTALLTAARKAVREYKDKLRQTECEISKTNTLKQDLELSQYEVLTLKKLMYGKDYLVTQKTKALDLSKEIIEVLNDSIDNDHMLRIQHLIDRAAGKSGHQSQVFNEASGNGSISSPSDSEYRSPSAPPFKYRSSTPSPGHQKDINVNHHPYPQENDHNGNHVERHSNQKVFLNRVIIDSQGKRKRPMSALAHPVNHKSSIHRTSSLKEAQKVYRKPLPRKSNRYEVEQAPNSRPNSYKSDKTGNCKLKPSLDYKIGPQEGNVEKLSDCSSPRETWAHIRDESFSDDESVFSDDSECEENVSPEQERSLQHISAKEKDIMMSDIITVGDRILISCPQKPPRYGKKKVLKPINYTGIVKFRGKFDSGKYDARVHVGVRMDEPVGDTDGTFKGKRYMYTPGDQGKFFKIREVTSVLNVKTGRYIPMNRLLLHHMHRRKASHIEFEDAAETKH